jgi:hypothetical protein
VRARLRGGATGVVTVARNPGLRQIGLSLAGVSLGESAFAVGIAISKPTGPEVRRRSPSRCAAAFYYSGRSETAICALAAAQAALASLIWPPDDPDPEPDRQRSPVSDHRVRELDGVAGGGAALTANPLDANPITVYFG